MGLRAAEAPVSVSRPPSLRCCAARLAEIRELHTLWHHIKFEFLVRSETKQLVVVQPTFWSLPFFALPPAQPPATQMMASNFDPFSSDEIESNTFFSYKKWS